jgi:hypothetical protein
MSTERIEEEVQGEGHEIEIPQDAQRARHNVFGYYRIEQDCTVRRIEEQKRGGTDDQHLRCTLRNGLSVLMGIGIGCRIR